MKTKTINIIICFILICILTIGVNARELDADYIRLNETNDYWELVDLIDEYQAKCNEIHESADELRALGYADESNSIQNLKSQWTFYNEIVKYYQGRLAKVNKELDDLEYKDATLIWQYMKHLGWNDYVCAGILGNMMAEVGGGTLDLLTCANTGNGFYGLCQWNQVFVSDVWGKDLKGQMDFLRDDIKYQIDMFGFCYTTDFNYEKFLELENEQDAALAFMKCYERGLPISNYVRQQYATIALEYYTTH